VSAARPAEWVAWVNAQVSAAELARVRASVGRSRPFGAEGWQRGVAAQLGVEATLRPRGRPRKPSADTATDK
jgi:putative transposase